MNRILTICELKFITTLYSPGRGTSPKSRTSANQYENYEQLH